MFQKISDSFRLFALIIVFFNSIYKLAAQENPNDSIVPSISPVMMSFNGLTSIIGEYGGNIIFSLGDKSQAVITFNLINSDLNNILYITSTSNFTESLVNQGFSIAPEYRYLFDRHKVKGWTLSSFWGAYFMYKEVYESYGMETYYQGTPAENYSEQNLNHLAFYRGSSIGLTLGVNLYSSSNFFLSLWVGRGINIRSELNTIYNRYPEKVESLTGLRDLGIRQGFSIGFYL